MIQSRVHMRLQNKLNMLYLHTNGCQTWTWKGGKTSYMFDHVSSCDKLGLLNLPYQNVYGQQTCPLAEDLWEALKFKVTWSHFDRVANW